MQDNVQILEKKSIEAALRKDWQAAIELNQQILDKDTDNKNAKVRLGRAFIKVKKFSEAKKIFKEVLEIDPINSIALKNYKLASEKNPDSKAEVDTENSTKVLIKEPGTTTQVGIDAPDSLLATLEPGQKLTIKSYKTKLTFFLGKKEIGSIKNGVSHAVYYAKKDGCDVVASVIKPNKTHFTVLLKCKKPIFESEKQRERPYLGGSLLGEEKVEIPELEETEE
ncbi:tetratricopeptide repeat protein [Patescibacteria group bacterium]